MDEKKYQTVKKQKDEDNEDNIEGKEKKAKEQKKQSILKKVIYGITAIVSLIVFFLSIVPVMVASINVGIIIPAVFSILLAIYCLLSLKFPLENIPWKQEMTSEYKEKIQMAQKQEGESKVKFRRSIILGIKKEALEEYDAQEDNYVPGMIMSREKRVIIDRAVWTLVIFAVFMTGILSYMMLNGYRKYDGNFKGQTVVVLGAKVNGDSPSQSLRRRLDGSIKILNDNKEAKCIVTGGKGKGETRAEADVMKKYLVENGIDEKRILVENKSKRTIENIQFAKNIAKENKLSQNFIVVTDKYHLYRASNYCKTADVGFYGYGVGTRNDLVASYWMREMMAVFHEFILG